MVRGLSIPRFSRDAVVRDLRALASRVGRPLLAIDLEDQPRLHAAIRRHFGKLSSALKAAGLPSPAASSSKWSRARVINELRQVHREGIQITERGLRAAGRGDLVGAARMYAGSFAAARKLARLPGPPRLSKPKIIAEIRQYGVKGIHNLPKRLQSACIKYFGSIVAARAAAGVPSRQKTWSRDVIVEELRQRAARGEPVDANLASACQRHFGSIPAAKRAAGVPLRRPLPSQWSRERVVEAVRRHARHGGGGLSAALARACRRYLGSVAAARAAAGVELLQKTWSKRAIIAAIRTQVARGGPLDRDLAAASHAHFGSLNAAREAAGVPTVKKRWSRDAVIAELRRLRGGPDNRLRQAARQQFGSLRAAYAAAGLAPRKAAWTRERIIAELRAGRIDPRLIQAAQRHFGSLTEARRAAGRELRTYWNPELVIREIRRCRSAAWPASLKHAAGRQFGSIAAARRAAGVEAPQGPRSPERVVVGQRRAPRDARPASSRGSAH